MDWDDLRYALEVARTGSIAAAARALGVAHTTVYRRVNAFEEASGVRFFDRVASGYTPTDAGRTLLELGREIETKIVDFERALQGHDARLEGEVTIATMEPLASKLAGILQGFRRMYPGIQVRLHVSRTQVDLAKREADIAVRASGAPGNDLVGRRLATLAFATYASRGYATQGELDPARAAWICFDDSLAQTPQGRWEREHVPAERVVFRTNSRAVFVESIAAGVGIGVLPCGLAAQSPSLVPVGDVIGELSVPLWILVHPDLQKSPRVRVLFDYLAEAIGRERALLENAQPAG